jgi:hypothetical protein
MRVPVYVDHHTLEYKEICYYVEWEKSIRCDDFYDEHEYEIDEVELDRIDLEKIVDEYLDDIIDILLSDRKLMNILLKKLKKLEEKNSK